VSIAVGLTRSSDQNDLRVLASSRNDYHRFTGSYTDLPNNQQAVETVSLLICAIRPKGKLCDQSYKPMKNGDNFPLLIPNPLIDRSSQNVVLLSVQLICTAVFSCTILLYWCFIFLCDMLFTEINAAAARARIVRCGGRYDPQLVKRSSEWVSELLWHKTKIQNIGTGVAPRTVHIAIKQ